jgi:hypothetical protein
MFKNAEKYQGAKASWYFFWFALTMNHLIDFL